jgi:hypothetical protein
LPTKYNVLSLIPSTADKRGEKKPWLAYYQNVLEKFFGSSPNSEFVGLLAYFRKNNLEAGTAIFTVP